MVSIGLATYNGGKYLRTQLDSVLRQSYKDFEVIICDDGSKDDTLEILEEYSKKDCRLHYYVNEQNLGFKKNFEKILGLCIGDYIAFCDQDDEWTEDHLEVLLDTIGDKDMAGANAELVDGDLNPLGYTMKDALNIQCAMDDKELLGNHILHGNVFQGTASMITSSLKSKILPIPENVKFHDYWAAVIASLNKGCVYTDKVVLKYRQHGNNVTENKNFTFVRGLAGFFNRSGLRKDLKEKVVFLSEVIEFEKERDSSVDIKELELAKNYNLDLLHHRNIRAVIYMLKHYDSLYYGQNNTPALKRMRVVRKLFGL